MNDYYIYCLEYNNKTYYTIYYMAEHSAFDGFLCNNGLLICFKTKEDLQKYIRTNKITLKNDEVDVLEIDSVSDNLKHLQKGKSNPTRCKQLLNFWNAITDLCHSINNNTFLGNRNEDTVLGLYDKMFYGCNTAANNPEKKYYPQFDDEEYHLLKEIYDEGFRILLPHLKYTEG